MGYCMSMNQSEFKIPADKVAAALQAVKDLAGKETIQDNSGGHFAWVEHDFAKSTTLQDIVHCWRWELEADDVQQPGTITGILFVGEKLGDDNILFQALAPFVVKGSYIEMSGEDGSLWRWMFNGKTVKEVSATVTWSDD